MLVYRHDQNNLYEITNKIVIFWLLTLLNHVHLNGAFY